VPDPVAPADTAAHPVTTEGDAAPYQSLYRRYRPQRFSEVLGQEHVTVPLHNAVRSDTVTHAYLFSGPRGTGKTSTARILAKALNCTDPQDGEPCGTCSSCQEITRGTSMDVHELDAASNNGVDAMRDLVARAALGTPGRTKVYIVDEVHMLSTAASNALLKTLEEPPPHVVFVLATTDPQKVLPTIRSRTQPFEFRLLGPDVLSGLLRSVRDSAGLGLDDTAVDSAVRRGRGSARDALSILDQVAAGGMVDDEADVLQELGDALAERDSRRCLVAVGRALNGGADPQRLAAELADQLRQAFLAVLAPEVVTVPDADRARLQALAERMGLPAVVRAMERLGTSQVAMRDAPDPRAHLEVALVRLVSPDLDDTVAALVERVDRLERTMAGGGLAPVPSAAPSAPTGPAPAAGDAPAPAAAAPPVDALAGAAAPAEPAADGERRGGPGMARATLGSVLRKSGGGAPGGTPPSPAAPSPAPRAPAAPSPAPPAAAAPAPAPAPAPQAPAPPAAASAPAPAPTPAAPAPVADPAPTASGPAADAAPAPHAPAAAPSAPVSEAAAAGTAAGTAGGAPSREDLVQAWGDHVLASLSGRARARFRVGRFVAVEDGPTAVFALPNETHRSYCEEVRRDVEQALSGHFGIRLAMRLVVDEEPGTATAGGGAPSDPRRVADETDGAYGSADPSAATGPDPATAGSAEDDESLLDPEVLRAETDLAGAGPSLADRLKRHFPGAEEA
jgi:DNA polymerase-3 subunit gamma/tau